jgi:hypothetical protein
MGSQFLGQRPKNPVSVLGSLLAPGAVGDGPPLDAADFDVELPLQGVLSG